MEPWPEYTRAEAAIRAGLSQEYIDRLIELGILTPDADDRLTKGDVRRAQMAQTLETAGIALEGLAAGIGQGHLTLDFMDSHIYERFATLGNETFAQRAERTGIQVNLLLLIPTRPALPLPIRRIGSGGMYWRRCR